MMTENTKVTAPAYLIEKSKLIEDYLLEYLPSPDVYPHVLHEAIRYSVMAGGKRLRPVLALAAYEACDGDGQEIYKAAVALELVHTYSLIHDDLPCMDDDDLRRGRPTLHKKYGEAIALLAGDALHDFAFRLMAETGRADVVLELAKAIGTGGMLGGQMADMEAEGRNINLKDVGYIHNHKTGKLIRSAVRIGSILANSNDKNLQAITLYGEKIGLAFQIIDDILDIEGDTNLLGKPIGSDSKNKKATYPSVIGLSKSHEIAGQLIEEAINAVESVLPKCDNFINIARFIGGRRY
ncbi:MAG: polyprenyl synthetase family protein [Candidatus Zixiibacteriota bacterium]